MRAKAFFKVQRRGNPVRTFAPPAAESVVEANYPTGESSVDLMPKLSEGQRASSGPIEHMVGNWALPARGAHREPRGAKLRGTGRV